MPEIERRESPSGRRVFDEAQDATRRTRLANERTYLAWWRTGLTALAVSLAAGRVVPTLSHRTAWPYEIVGAGFAVLGVACIVNAYQREREIDRALTRGPVRQHGLAHDPRPDHASASSSACSRWG